MHPDIDPDKMTFGVDAENTEGHPANDTGRRNPWIDVPKDVNASWLTLAHQFGYYGQMHMIRGLMAAALTRQDISQWAGARGIALVRGT